LIRQLLTESSMLAVAGGVLGLLIYWWLSSLLGAQLRQDITPDLTTVGFTMVFALGTGILFGLSPAFHATRSDAADALKDSAVNAGGRNRLQRAFVVAQIALTQPLLVGLSVMITILSQGARDETNPNVADRAISVVFNMGSISIRPGEGNPLASTLLQDQADRADAAMARVAALPGIVGVVRSGAGAGSLDLTVVPEDARSGRLTPGVIDVRTQEIRPGYFKLFD